MVAQDSEKDQKELAPLELYLGGAQATDGGWLVIDDGSQGKAPIYYWNVGTRQLRLEKPPEVGVRKTWADGTNIYCNRGRCCRCQKSDEIKDSGCHIFTADQGRLAVSFILCNSCLNWLVCKAQEELEVGPDKFKVPPPEEIRGDVPTENLHENLQTKKWAPGVGTLLVNSKFAQQYYAKCLYMNAEGRYMREGRAQEQDGVAMAAQKHLEACAEGRRRVTRAREMKLKCLYSFQMGPGEYLCWLDKDKRRVEYYGEMKGGEANGIGYAEYPDGCWCQGNFVREQPHTTRIHPTCTWQWPDGRKYVGNMVKGRMHGHGVKTWPDGRVYTGEFAMGREHGEGTMTWPDGSEHSGRFRFGSRDGPGSYTNVVGLVQKGNFKDGHSPEYAMKEGSLGVDDNLHESGVPKSNNNVRIFEPRSPLPLVDLALTALATQIDKHRDIHTACKMKGLIPRHLIGPLVSALSNLSETISPGLRKELHTFAWVDSKCTHIGPSRLDVNDMSMLRFLAPANCMLKVLKLRCCNLRAPAMIPLSAIIREVHTLKTLDISWNPIGKLGAETVLKAAISGPGGLVNLLLAGCNLGPSGCVAAAQYLSMPSALTCVDLGFNDAGAIGARALADAISVNTTLTTLGLRMNGFGPVGGDALSKGLLANCGTLKNVMLADNHMGPGVTALVAGCVRGGAAHAVRGFGFRSQLAPKFGTSVGDDSDDEHDNEHDGKTLRRSIPSLIELELGRPQTAGTASG